MCLQRYELDTKRNFWRRYDDVYPKVQIHFHFNSKSAIKNALELVLGPFTSNPKQVKKFFLGGTGKFQDPPLEISRTRPVILCPLKNSRTPPPGKFQDPTSHKVLDTSKHHPLASFTISFSTSLRELAQRQSIVHINSLSSCSFSYIGPMYCNEWRLSNVGFVQRHNFSKFLCKFLHFYSHFHRFGSFQHHLV